MNLSEKFYQYLLDNQIAEFSSKETFEWYAFHKQSPGSPDLSNVHGLILKPLITKGLIKKVLYHTEELVDVAEKKLGLEIQE